MLFLPSCEFSILHSSDCSRTTPQEIDIDNTYRNAAIIPVVYLCYPETAYRSLEEVDTIFRKTKGWFDVVRIARDEPLRYGKNGERLGYEQTVEHAARSQDIEFGAAAETSAGVLKDVNKNSEVSSNVEMSETV